MQQMFGIMYLKIKLSEMSQFLAWLLNRLFTKPFYLIWNNFVIKLKDYTVETLEHLVIAFILYILICILLYLCITKWNFIEFRKDIKSYKRILLITAHPDDECMFFGPTVRKFVNNPKCSLYLMCLSTGKNYGMGTIRKNELYESCKSLGILEENIIVHNHTLMPDSMEEKWPPEVVAKEILKHVEVFDIDTIITFDKEGVSHHLNHCSLYYAVAHLSLEKKLPQMCKVYVLESVNILRKYWSIFDIPFCYLLSRNRYILNCQERKVIFKSMEQHKSQLTFYRRLYLIFSRYTIINTLQEMDIVDIELDLQLED